MASPNPGREDNEIDKIFMATACLVSKFSEDPVTKVGACIVSQDGNVVGTGYNSMPNGTTGLPWDKDQDDPHWNKYSYANAPPAVSADVEENKELPSCLLLLRDHVCHTVLNAIMNANKTDLSGCTVYTTLFPGGESTKIIIQAGIKKVVYLSDKYREKPEMVACKTMLAKASVDNSPYPRPRDTVEIQFSSFYGPGELEKLEAQKFEKTEG